MSKTKLFPAEVNSLTGLLKDMLIFKAWQSITYSIFSKRYFNSYFLEDSQEVTSAWLHLGYSLLNLRVSLIPECIIEIMFVVTTMWGRGGITTFFFFSVILVFSTKWQNKYAIFSYIRLNFWKFFSCFSSWRKCSIFHSYKTKRQ